jgi:very-short-patch-repair endonuclease
VSDLSEPDPTRSELERRFLNLCRRHGIPLPEVNVRVDAFTVDFLWRDARLIVETDGFQTHGTRFAFEADRARDARLKAIGFEVLRFTWRQLTRDGPAVAETVRAVRGRRLRSYA